MAQAQERYTRIKSKFWTDEKVREWDDDTKLLALYLMTSPHRNILGCYCLPKGYITEDLGWSLQRLAKPFAKLLADGFIKYDEEAKLILVVNFLKHNPIENRNQAVAAKKQVMELPRSGILQDLKGLLEPFGERFGEPLGELFGDKVKVKGKVKEKDLNNMPDSNPLPNGLANPLPNGLPNSLNQDKPKDQAKKKNDYTPEFERFWSIYPRKEGKVDAFKAWNARLKEGITPAEIMQATENYIAHLRAKGTEPQYIKQPRTFLGPGKHIQEWLNPPIEKTMNVPKAWHTLKRYLEEDQDEKEQGDEGGWPW